MEVITSILSLSLAVSAITSLVGYLKYLAERFSSKNIKIKITIDDKELFINAENQEELEKILNLITKIQNENSKDTVSFEVLEQKPSSQ